MCSNDINSSCLLGVTRHSSLSCIPDIACEDPPYMHVLCDDLQAHIEMQGAQGKSVLIPDPFWTSHLNLAAVLAKAPMKNMRAPDRHYCTSYQTGSSGNTQRERMKVEIKPRPWTRN